MTDVAACFRSCGGRRPAHHAGQLPRPTRYRDTHDRFRSVGPRRTRRDAAGRRRASSARRSSPRCRPSPRAPARSTSARASPTRTVPRQVREAAKLAIDDGREPVSAGPRHPPAPRGHRARTSTASTGIELDAEREVLVTAGATEAIAATLLALLEPGDEVVTFEPFYDSYARDDRPGRRRARDGSAARARLPARSRRAARCRHRTHPHHPDQLSAQPDRHRARHAGPRTHRGARPRSTTPSSSPTRSTSTSSSTASSTSRSRPCPAARERTITISSGAKTFSLTGWKIGWLIAPAELVDADPHRQAVPHLRERRAVPAGHRPRAQPARRLLRGCRSHPRRQARPARSRVAPRRASRSAGPAARTSSIADAAPLGFDDAVEFCRRLPRTRGRRRHPSDRLRATGAPCGLPLAGALRILQAHRGARARIARSWPICAAEPAARVIAGEPERGGQTGRPIPLSWLHPRPTAHQKANPVAQHVDVDLVLDAAARSCSKTVSSRRTCAPSPPRPDHRGAVAPALPLVWPAVRGLLNREYAGIFRMIVDHMDRDPLGGLLSHIYRHTLGAVHERPLARALYLTDPVALNTIMREAYGFDYMPRMGARAEFIDMMKEVGMVRHDIDSASLSAHHRGGRGRGPDRSPRAARPPGQRPRHRARTCGRHRRPGHLPASAAFLATAPGWPALDREGPRRAPVTRLD